MTKTEQTIVLAAGVLIAGSYLLKGRALKNLVFSNGQLQSIGMQGATPIIDFTVLAQNTASIGITLQSLAGNIYTDDLGQKTLIGNISNFSPVLIAANQQTFIPLQCRTRIVGVVNDLISAFQNRNFQMALVVQAWANVDGIQFAIPEFTMPVGL